MVTLGEYAKDILVQIRSLARALLELKDRPGDLMVLNREWQRITGLLRSLANRIEASGNNSDLYVSILDMSRGYIESYYFGRELETMADLYSTIDRLKNMRLKIIESLHDRSFIDSSTRVIAEI